MDGDVAIVVPMKVWTPGLHGFRTKHLRASRAMIPPHIPIVEWRELQRGDSGEARRLAARLQQSRQEFSAFPYTLCELVWNETDQTLSLGTSSPEPFLDLRRRIQKALGLHCDYREKYEAKLLLAANSPLKSQYPLEEAFYAMNGNPFSITCRATEIEIYRRRAGDWLLREVVPMQESEEN